MVFVFKVFNSSFSESVCATNGQRSDLLEEVLKSTNTSTKLNECQVFFSGTNKLTFEKAATSDFEKTNLEKARAIELLKSIAIVKKSKHHTDFLESNDSFFRGIWQF